VVPGSVVVDVVIADTGILRLKTDRVFDLRV